MMKLDFSPHQYVLTKLHSSDDYAEFIDFAFGGESATVDHPMKDLPAIWTELHPEVPVSERDVISDSLNKMIAHFLAKREEIELNFKE
jgi:hypothetical protein